jgi:hypothetical protein
MADDKPGAFSLFVDWLYRSTIRPGHSESYLHDLYDLYILAEFLVLPVLRNQTMDRIQDVAREYDLLDILIAPKLVKKVCDGVPRITGLKEFCIYTMGFAYLHRAKASDDTVDRFFVSDEDMTSAWLIFKDDLAMFRLFHKRVSAILRNLVQRGSKYIEEIGDPRERYEEDPEDRCFFHAHEEDYNCRPKKKPQICSGFWQGKLSKAL